MQNIRIKVFPCKPGTLKQLVNFVIFILFPIIFLYASDTVNGQAPHGKWETVLQPSGDITDFHAFDEHTAIAVGRYGYIIKTNDGLETTKFIVSGIPESLGGVTFADWDNGWTVGSKGAIYFSSDTGETWQKQISGTNLGLKSVFFVDINTGWAAGDSGIILHTRNGGQLWEKQLSGTDRNIFDIMFIDDATGWAAGQNGLVIFTSDGGKHWEILANDIAANLNKILFVDRDTGWASACQRENTKIISFYSTADGGVNWTPHHTLQVDGFHFLNGRQGWIANFPNGVQHSDDGGGTWNAVSQSSASLQKIFFVNKETGWGTRWGIRFSTLNRTEDGGNTWKRSESPPVFMSFYFQNLFFINESKGWVVGSNGVILHTSDQGASWNRQNAQTNKRLNDVFFTDENTGWIVGAEGLLLHTMDGGENWEEIPLNLSNDLNAIHFVESKPGWFSKLTNRKKNRFNGWICGHDDLILRSTDSGKHWEKIELTLSESDIKKISRARYSLRRTNPLNLIDIFFINANTGWAKYRFAGIVLHTKNGGKDWKVLENYEITNYHFYNQRKGWGYRSTTEPGGHYKQVGRILKTKNAGKSWKLIHSTDYWFSDIYFLDDKTGWAIGISSENVLYTQDGGKTWHEQPLPFKNLPLNKSFFVNKNLGWIIGMNGVIFKYTGQE